MAAGSTEAVTLATFTDPGPAVDAGDYTVTVDWGDGSDADWSAQDAEMDASRS